MIGKYGRKFFLCVWVLLFSVGLRIFSLLTGGELVALVLGTIGAFVASNVVQDFAPKEPK